VSDAYHETRLTPDPNRRAVWRHVMAYLEPFVDRAHPVLDIGAGHCDALAALDGVDRIALDVAEVVRDWAPPGVRVVVGSCLDLSFLDDASVGTVLASNLLEHLDRDDVDRALAEVRRVLRPGGHFVLIQPNFRLQPRRYFDDYTHRTIFTDESLHDLLAAAGFDVVRRENRFLPFSMKSRGSGLVFLVPWYLRSPWRPRAGQMLMVGRR
jgi:SAM-dependent methyltransferase